MSTLAGLTRRHRGWAIGMAATLLIAGAHARPACPELVTTPAGSVFNVAALIADNGSPEAGLAKIRSALAKIDAGGGCRIFSDIAACEETVALAKRTAAALEKCAAPVPRNGHAQTNDTKRPAEETENDLTPRQ
ncbi:hypothetical protein P3T21_003808 [Paraburkholderia sp. GAS334]|jgi:hypothetical protein